MLQLDRARGIVLGTGSALLLALNIVAIGAPSLAADGAADGDVAEWPTLENVPTAASSTGSRVRASRRLVAEADARARRILAGLTLDQKIGQLTQGEIQAVSPDDVRRFCLGSVLNGGGSWPGGNRYASPGDWRNLADAYWQAGIDGCGIPPLWGTDSVHGNSNVYGATLFPHNIGLGAADNPALMREIGRITAKETRATGQAWVFAPTVAVARDDRWGRTYESYSEDAERVARLARPLVEGLQGSLGECRVAATLKHWIGDGGTTGGRDQGNTQVAEAELVAIHGLPYFDGLKAGALSVMPSFSSWNGEKLHGDRYLLRTILKERLGFSGLVISDWNGHGQVPDCFNTDCPQAFEAGIDLFMVPYDWRTFIAVARQRALDGEISMDRIDDAVSRILRNKILLAMFEQKPSDSRCATDDQLGRQQHREVARDAVRQSLVLLKNNDGLLPLSRDLRILVAGKNSNSIANQSGGWSITWQGTGTSNFDFPGATSVRAAIAEVAPRAEWVPDVGAVDPESFDVAIAVIGETPYAEGVGDLRSNQTLEHARLHPEDLTLLQTLKDAELPVVTIWIAGRPLHVNRELNRSDAFVAAWLPGSEGGGIADVLFADPEGEVHHDFVGTLSFSWPSDECQTPLNHGEHDGALFPFGYGLTYRDSTTVGPLDESSDELGCGFRDTGGEEATEPLEIFVQGANIDPWRLRIGDSSNWDGLEVDLSTPAAVTSLRNIQAGPRVDSPSFQFGGITVDFGVGTPGVGPGQFYVQSEAAGGQDLLSYLASPNGSLVFDLRASAPPPYAVSLRVDCGYPCSGQLNVTQAFNEVSDGQWHELAIPLGCFADRGADFSKISAPFLVFTYGPWLVDFASIRWEPDRGGNVTCDGNYEP